MGSRATLLGAQDSLESINTFTLDDGALCYVTAVRERFGLQRTSTASPDGTTVIAPTAGPGRWILEGGSTPFVIPFPVADISAVGIPDGRVVVAQGGIAVWAQVPTAFSITSFSHSPTLVQVGSSVVSPAFTASYNQTPTAAVLTDTEGHTDNVIGTPTSFVSPHTFTKAGFNQSVTFTLTASDSLGGASSAISVVWGQDVYYGASTPPGSFNQAFITSLTSHLTVSPNGNYAITAGVGQTSYFCALTALGLTVGNFFVGGFPFACSKVASAVSVTNTDGVTATYDVFGSDNPGLGPFTLTVQ
jgi:hypothetical protein